MTLQSLVGIFRELTSFISQLGSDAEKFHHDVDSLIDELSRTARSLEDLRTQLRKTSERDAQFEKEFTDLFRYFKSFYSGRQNFSKARTHCSDVRRSVRKIHFKITRLLTTDLDPQLDAWSRVEEAIGLITRDDETFKNLYLAAVKNLNENLTHVDRIFRKNPERAKKTYSRAVKEFEKHLRNLDEIIDAISDAQLTLRDHVG